MGPAAVLDVDGTLLEGSLGIEFTAEYFTDSYPYRGGIEDNVGRWLEDDSYSYSQMTRDVVKHWARGLEGRSVSDIQGAAEEFVLDYDIPASSRSIVAGLEQEGFDVYLASINPQEVLEPFAREIEAGRTPEAFGTRVDSENGVYTGELVLDTSGHHGKEKAVEQIGRKSDLENGVAMGDTVTDIPILEAVGRPILISPSEDLRRYAERNSWNYEEYVNIEELLEQ